MFFLAEGFEATHTLKHAERKRFGARARAHAHTHARARRKTHTHVKNVRLDRYILDDVVKVTAMEIVMLMVVVVNWFVMIV